MPYSVASFCEFYATPLGQAAGHQIQACIHKVWPDLDRQCVLGIGYAMPYLDFYLKPSQPVFTFLPCDHGMALWPDNGLSRVAAIDNGSLPLADQSVDNILLIHALEHTGQPRLLLREAWRVLKGNGRLLVIVPNRRSMWAHLDTTPFGYGQPFTMTQLVHTLGQNLFTPVTFKRALYMAPSHSRWMMACQPFLDKGGPWILQKFSGVVCVESIKQVYTGTLAPLRKSKLVPSLKECKA